MVEQVVGLEFIVTGATEATAAIKRMADSQAQLTGSISKSLGITQRVENEVRKLAKSYTDGSLNLNQYTKAVSQTANAYGVFIGSNKRARSDVAALSTAMVAEANAQKQSTQAKTAAAAVIKAESQALKDYRQARRDATAENKRYNAESKATAQAARAVTQQEERLRLKYVQGHAAMEIYSRELNDLAMARKGDIISADQQQQAVAELNMAMAKGTGAFAGVGTAAQVGGRRMNSFGMLTQQAGYQLGDFAVQVQGGTNPMVAFGQQATQMIGAFNLLPKATLMATVGIGVLRISVVALIASLGVIIPVLTAIGAYFMRTNAEAKEAASGVDTLEDKINSLKDSLVDYTNAQAALTSGVSLDEYFAITNLDKVSDELKKAKDDLANLTISEGLAGALLGALPFIGDNVGVQAEIDAYNAAVEKVKAAEEVLANLRLKQADERFKNFDKERVELEEQLAMAQEIARFGEDSNQVAKLALEQRIAAFDRNIDQQLAANQLAVDQGIILKEVNAEIAKTEFATEEIERNQDLIKSGAEVLNTVWSNLKAIVSDAADDAGRFADNLVLGQGYLDAAVRSGVSSGAIPPQALQDLPQTPAQKAMERILDQRRRDARRPDAPDTPSGGGASNVVDITAILDARRQQIEQERVLLGLSGQQREAQAIYFDLLKQNEDAVNGLKDTELMRAANVLAAEQEKNRVIEEGLKRQQDISNLLESSMERAFMSIVDGTMSVKDAFKAMASDIIKELYRIFVVKQITGMIANAIFPGSGALVTNANGNAFSNGNVVPFANGGVVGSPTTFPMAGGKTGLMGEAGPEAIMPLKRGKDGKLGVAADGGGAVTVNNYFTVQANGDDSVKRIVRQQIPQIAEATKAAVVDAKRRGGSYGRAFG
jgi:hypothetical protein